MPGVASNLYFVCHSVEEDNDVGEYLKVAVFGVFAYPSSKIHLRRNILED